MKSTDTRSKRPYEMRARATAAEATGRRIMQAAREVFMASHFDDVSLEAIATRAGVTVQTVLRRFGTKEQLFSAVAEQERKNVRAERNESPIGDIAGAVRNLIEHYEAYGDMVMHWLAQEERIRVIRQLTDHGRALHREWVERTFAPYLGDLAEDERQRRLASFIVATDVSTWKLLRRDLQLSPDQVEWTLRDMLTTLAERG